MQHEVRWAGARLRAALAALRRVAGMPDYEAFAVHHRSCHPERPLPSRREHFAQFVAERYGGGPTRCC